MTYTEYESVDKKKATLRNFTLFFLKVSWLEPMQYLMLWTWYMRLEGQVCRIWCRWRFSQHGCA